MSQTPLEIELKERLLKVRQLVDAVQGEIPYKQRQELCRLLDLEVKKRGSDHDWSGPLLFR